MVKKWKIVHVSQNKINKTGGMGRVEYYWKEAFNRNNCDFIHIGEDEVGVSLHQFFFGLKVILYLKKNKIFPDVLIVHEPYAFWFKFFFNCLVFMESHGLELRNDVDSLDLYAGKSFKTRLFYPLWREIPCKLSVRYSDYLLLLNDDDLKFAVNNFNVSKNKILVYKNGYIEGEIDNLLDYKEDERFKVLFNATWLDRKGIHTLVSSAINIYKRGYKFYYVLIGTGFTIDYVLNFWPQYLHEFIDIVPKFESSDEKKYLHGCSIFVLPSLKEGQPLSLIQAMALGKCCITTNADGQKDLIIDKYNGFLFEINDSVKLADLIIYCHENKQKVLEIGENAKISMKERDWNTVSLEVVNFILKTLK